MERNDQTFIKVLDANGNKEHERMSRGDVELFVTKLAVAVTIAVVGADVDVCSGHPERQTAAIDQVVGGKLQDVVEHGGEAVRDRKSVV